MPGGVGAALAPAPVFKGSLEKKPEGSSYSGEITLMSALSSHRRV